MSRLPVRTWIRQVTTLDEQLAAFRLLLAPVILILGLLGKRRLVAVTVLSAAASDVLDGTAARFAGQRSSFSKQLDTVADIAVIATAPALVAKLYPDSFHRRGRPLAVLGVVAGGVLGLEWLKFRRVGAMHIDSARGSSVVAHVWLLNLLIRGRDNPLLFGLFILSAVGAAFESLYVILRKPGLDHLSETPLIDDFLAAAHLPNPMDRLPFHDPERRMGRTEPDR